MIEIALTSMCWNAFVKPLWSKMAKPRLLVSTVKKEISDLLKIITERRHDVLDTFKQLMIYFKCDDEENKALYNSVLARAKKLPNVSIEIPSFDMTHKLLGVIRLYFNFIP